MHVHIDPETRRIVASAKVERYLKPATTARYHRGQQLECIIQQSTPLGLKVIADNRCPGMLYRDQMFDDEPRTGDVVNATVVNVRPDGKLDLSLQRIGKSRFRDFADTLLDELQACGGTLPFHDGSTPEAIQQRFGVSKKTFKRALGTLYKAQRIRLLPDGIALL